MPRLLLSAGFLAAAVAVAAVVLSLGSTGAPTAEASFHQMRVYSVMGGFNGDETAQFVELRMATGGQTQVGGHVICFFSADGSPWARFKFPNNVGNGDSGDSILVGSGAFDAAWGAGGPDFFFLPGTTTAIAFDASNTEPVPFPAGYVGFGSDSASQPSEMCLAGYSEIDSVAYGAAYTGGVNFGTKLASDLPTDSTSAIGLTGALCNPCTRDNSADYGIVDTNEVAHQPRNNSGDQGLITPGEPTPTPGPTGTPGPSPTPGGKVLVGDMDCDGDVDSVDGLAILRAIASLPGLPQEPGCPDVGAAGGIFGDLGCDGALDAVDALRVLRFVAGLSALNAPVGCPAVGTSEPA